MPIVRGVAAALTVALCACSSAPTTTAPAPATASGRPIATVADVERVTFASGDLTIVGDLRRPDGAGPHPAVVLLHGSGPVSRDGIVPGQLGMAFPRPIAVFADLANALRDAGYVVLAYDKRTCGPFNGCADNGYPQPSQNLSVEAFADDAIAAVRYLRSRPDVRTDAVALVGHSQGASLVPGMLLDDPRLAAGVLLAAPYDAVDDLLAAQAETLDTIVAALDPVPPGAAQQVTQLRRLAGSVRALRTGPADDTAVVGGVTVGFWRSWMRVADGVPQLAEQAEQPLLVLGGTADTNVPPLQTARWRRTLTGERDRVVELACVSHALNCLHTNDPTAVDPARIDVTVDPRVPATIAAFLDDVLSGRG